jgi:hypothetical protein
MDHSEHNIVLSVAIDQATNGDVALECHDPMIVRADAVVIDRERHTLAAVVDGILAELGVLSDELLMLFVGQQKVMVTARHFSGHHVRRRIPIINH